METQFLCGSVDAWQRRRIELLENNSIAYADVVWKVEDSLLPDCRQMYAESEFFRLLFESSLSKGTVSEDGVTVFPLDEKIYIFHMIRVFCHTGLVMYTRGESILRTLERYAAFRFYGIEHGKNIFRTLVQNTLTPVNAVQAFEYAIHRDDPNVLRDIEKYFCDYAFVIMRQRSFCAIKRESMQNLVALCCSDNLNISEADLLMYLYKLCERKVGDKEYCEFSDAISIMKHEFSSSGSLWNAIRLDRLSMSDFMDFTQKHPRAMSNDDIVQCMSTIFRLSSVTPTKTRKQFVPISSYPRNLKIIVSPVPQVDITRWERGKLQVFFVFPFGNAEDTQLPPVVAGSKRINCIVRHSDKCLGISGNIHGGAVNSGMDGMVNVTVSIVNFRHDRWKKATTSINMAVAPSFDIPNILSWNAIEGTPGTSSGYTFDLAKYPEYSGSGEHMSLMMYLSLSVVGREC